MDTQRVKEKITERWRQTVLAWYPDLYRSTVVVPPVYMYRIPLKSTTWAGQPVLQPAALASSGQTKKSLTKLAEENNSAARSQHASLTTATSSLSCNEKIVSSPGHPQNLSKMSPPLILSESPNTRNMWASHVNFQISRTPVYDSDTQDDQALQHVLHCLREFGQQGNQVMFLLAQLEFKDYLNDPSFADVAQLFPRPQDLEQKYHRGDFDLLIIHPLYGIIIGEVKAVGKLSDQLKEGQAKTHSALKKRLERVVKQMDKSVAVVKHMVKDIAPGIPVRKTLILPYVDSDQLLHVLNSDHKLLQMMCQCFEVSTVKAMSQQCLCAEQLSPASTPWHVTAETLGCLSEWWTHLCGQQDSPVLSDSIYLDLITRFSGPATTASLHCPIGSGSEVRTLGQAVSETGQRIMYLTLTPAQLAILREPVQSEVLKGQAEPEQPQKTTHTICLTGPPGTGKSVVLTLMGLWWLWQGVDVHVVSTWAGSMACCTMMEHQLNMTPCPSAKPRGVVHLHSFDLFSSDQGVEKVVDCLVRAASPDQTLCVLMDEALFINGKMAPRYARLVEQLTQEVVHLFLWVATVGKDNICSSLSQRSLTTPLRCTPAVTREVEGGVSHHSSKIHPYSILHPLPPCDGPKVMCLKHDGEGHEGKWPTDCFLSGQRVAGVLKELQISDENTAESGKHQGLNYSDVFVLTRNLSLTDGTSTSPASSFVQGLRSKEIPVIVLPWKQSGDDPEKWNHLVREVSTGCHNRVTVADYSSVRGLERKVVVLLPGRWAGVDDKRSDEEVKANERLHAMSRSTAQLVLFEVPEY